MNTAAGSRRGVAAAVVALLRPHHWSKSLLVFVPVLTAHRLDGSALATAAWTAIAFSLAASSAYALNDVMDREADRAHPVKRRRPVAAGLIAPGWAVAGSAALMLVALVIALAVSVQTTLVLITYLAATLLYTLWLKHLRFVDVATLAGLHVLRIVAGAVAIGVFVSGWLLAFSLSIFLLLALIKRYVEVVALPAESAAPPHRPYAPADAILLFRTGLFTAAAAAIVFVLYVGIDTRAHFSHPQLLWLACPLVVLWEARVLTLARSGRMHGDPVVFATLDAVSVTIGISLVALVVAAM